MFSLYVFSFLAGILTILAPCVLPVLPVILGGSLGVPTRKRSLVICVSFVISVVIFTLLLKVSTLFISTNPVVWTTISGVLLMGFGGAFLFPRYRDWIAFKIGLSQSQLLLNDAQKIKFCRGDMFLGMALGPVFSTCSPTYAIILAIIFPLSFIDGLISIIFYSVGIGLMLFLIVLLGRSFISKIKFLANPEGILRKILGFIILIVGILILTGYDKFLQTILIDRGFYFSSQREQKKIQEILNEHNIR